jgi:DNA-binding NtrC family response regulator
MLLIEDEPSDLAFVTQALKRSGYQVKSAGCTKAAFEVYDAHDGQFDLIFVDAVLPDGTGMEILGNLLDRDPNLHALLSSG